MLRPWWWWLAWLSDFGFGARCVGETYLAHHERPDDSGFTHGGGSCVMRRGTAMETCKVESGKCDGFVYIYLGRCASLNT